MIKKKLISEFLSNKKMPKTKKNFKTFDVERILEKRINSLNKVEYLIKWKGYSLKETTWEPYYHLSNCKDLIRDFELKTKKQKIQSLFIEDSDSLIDDVEEINPQNFVCKKYINFFLN